ncbi:MAG: NUMOD4 motif-containing HNH endonuclease [Selenomonadaceae bacterium]|nr:NUMOD4 motif-containing HNH endonuclease [Selenomonadaceae bacterium]
MNHNEAGEILRASVAGLAEPLKSAIEFTLTNFYQPSAAVEAKNFLSSVPYEVFMARDLRETNPELKAKIDAVYHTLMNDEKIRFGLDDLPHEQWRDVVGYEGLYKVSNYGRVKSFQKNKPTILVGYRKREYYKARLSDNKLVSVHKLVAQSFIPNPEDKPTVNHIDGNKLNNCVSNLEWATYSENNRHAYDTGLQKRGCERSTSKLTANQVRYIRENCIPRDFKFGMHALARRFGVSYSTINSVYHGRSYKNVI